MGQRHHLLTDWENVGRELAFSLPRPEMMAHLISALRRLAKTDTANAMEAILAMSEVAAGGRCDLQPHELLLLIEERAREARLQIEELMGLRDTLQTNS